MKLKEPRLRARKMNYYCNFYRFFFSFRKVCEKLRSLIKTFQLKPNGTNETKNEEKCLIGLEQIKASSDLLSKIDLLTEQGQAYNSIANHCRRLKAWFFTGNFITAKSSKKLLKLKKKQYINHDKGVCELSLEIVSCQSRFKRACNISHNWFWKVTRRQVEKELGPKNSLRF